MIIRVPLSRDIPLAFCMPDRPLEVHGSVLEQRSEPCSSPCLLELQKLTCDHQYSLNDLREASMALLSFSGAVNDIHVVFVLSFTPVFRTEVMMPDGAASSRAKMKAATAGVLHEKKTDAKLSQLIDELSSGEVRDSWIWRAGGHGQGQEWVVVRSAGQDLSTFNARIPVVRTYGISVVRRASRAPGKQIEGLDSVQRVRGVLNFRRCACRE